MDRKQKIIRAFNEFNLQKLGSLNDFYSEKIEFCDPLHSISGLSNLKIYFSKLYQNVSTIHFTFHNFVEDRNQVSCEWVMEISLKNLNSKNPYKVNGASFFKFDSNDLVVYHRDYLDVGQMVYEKIPFLGKVIIFFKRYI